jgi:peptidoglycan/LPS O-acetylase OafA/YrhL
MGESFPTIADALATGCLLAGHREQLISQRWYKGLLQSRFFLVLPALAFLANRYPPGRLHAGFIEPLVNICIAVTIDRFVRMPGTLTGRFLNLHPVSYLGGLSYSLYLWQQPFLRHQDSVAPCPINLLCALAMAWLSYRLVETPFLALRKRWELSMSERRLPPLETAPDLAAG